MSLTLTLAVLTATSAACGPKRVNVGGVEMSYEDGARAVLAQGVDAERQGDLATARTRYQEVVNNYEGSPSEPDALAALGLLLHRQGGCAPSRAYLERLAVDYPTHPRSGQAKALLNECPGATTAGTVTPVSASAEVLSTYERRFGDAATPAAKREVASAAADAALAAGDGAAAVRWLLRVRDQEPEPAQRAALEAEIEEVIEQHISFVDVRRLVETLSGGDFPRPLLLYKLGRIQYHVRDYAGAQETLSAYLQDSPSGAYAGGAKRLLARMAALADVRANRIGVLLPLSGKHRSYGELALQAVRLALGVDKNDRGGGLELVVRDTQSDGVVAAQMAEALIVDEHVVAILGPVFSYAAVPAARVAEQLGTPILTISTADELPQLGPYVFRNALTNRDQVEALVDHAMNILQMRTFAVLYPRHPYGEEMLQLFWEAVEQRKGEIRGVESYAMTDTTFTTQVKRLVARDVLNLRGDFKRAEQECDRQPDSYRKARCKDEVKKNLKPIVDFDGLFIPDYPKTIPMISAALAFEDIIVETDARRLRIIEKTLGRKVKPVTLMGGSGWNSAQVPERSGRNVENALFTDGFFPEADDKVVAEFVNAYQKAYRRTPRLYPEALFWDSAKMLAQVLQTQRPSSREALRAALTAMRDFPGVSGKTTFGGTNDAKRPVRILTIKDGRIQDIPDPDAPPEGSGAETPTPPQ